MKHQVNELDSFQQELKSALQRVDAPAGMLQAVLRQVTERRTGPIRFPGMRLRAWVGSVAASILVLGLALGGVERHRSVERARAERDFAKSQEITKRALEPVRDRLRRAGIALDE